MDIGTYEAQQRANVIAVRNRLMKPSKPYYQEMLSAQSSAAKYKAQIEELEMILEIKDLDIADLQSVLISQSVRICDLEGINPTDVERRSAKAIILDVLRDYPDIIYEDIVGKRRSKVYVIPRHACMKAVYTERKDMSLPQIGRVFNRDHTTVLHAVGRLNKGK